MESCAATRLFSALGHAGRLSVFRLLMRHAPQAVRPTEIAESLGLRPNTLSHHLAELEAAGLIRSERRGRSIRYSPAIDTAAALIAFLFEDCGRGRPELALPPVSALPQGRPRVLFLCSGNSARSILAEALLRDLGGGRFDACSAGTRPADAPHPMALEVLARHGHATGGLRPKPLAAFQAPGAPDLDFVFTLCDAAADEECPPWPGQPIGGHWGLPDPVGAAAPAPAFAETYARLRRRIAAFVALPFAELDRVALQARVDSISLDQP